MRIETFLRKELGQISSRQKTKKNVISGWDLRSEHGCVGTHHSQSEGLVIDRGGSLPGNYLCSKLSKKRKCMQHFFYLPGPAYVIQILQSPRLRNMFGLALAQTTEAEA